MPARKRLDQYDCALARTADLIGDPWSLLIIRDAAIGVSRFSEFRESIGIAGNILSARLRRLTAEGLLSLDDGRYRLTDKGRALMPALIALMQWGDRWTFDGKPPVRAETAAGRRVDPIALSAGGAPVAADQVRFVATPFATARTAGFLDAVSPSRQQ